MTDIVTGATYTKESLFQELTILREREKKLVEALAAKFEDLDWVRARYNAAIDWHDDTGLGSFSAHRFMLNVAKELRAEALREIGEGEMP